VVFSSCFLSPTTKQQPYQSAVFPIEHGHHATRGKSEQGDDHLGGFFSAFFF